MEHPAYRDNLEQVLKASNGRQMLTIADVKAITGIRHYQTLHKLFPFQGRYISAATLARCMCGGGKQSGLATGPSSADRKSENV